MEVLSLCRLLRRVGVILRGNILQCVHDAERDCVANCIICSFWQQKMYEGTTTNQVDDVSEYHDGPSSETRKLHHAFALQRGCGCGSRNY